MARSLPCSGESTTTECGVNYQLPAVITEVAQWGTPRTVDPIDWSHAPPSWAVPPERLVHSINRCSSTTAGIRMCNVATFSMRDNHLAYAATQGIKPPCLALPMRPLRIRGTIPNLSKKKKKNQTKYIWFYNAYILIVK